MHTIIVHSTRLLFLKMAEEIDFYSSARSTAPGDDGMMGVSDIVLGLLLLLYSIAMHILLEVYYIQVLLILYVY